MKRNGKKERLDTLLVSAGHFESREKARRAVMAGQVLVDGQKAEKAGQTVSEEALIEVLAREKYVGRGGLKLEGALDAFAIDPAGKVCLDVGASTGGFTDCLLQRGALRVHAIDVGHGQLDWRIRSDERVVVKEGLNARSLAFSNVGERVAICVADVSFISLTLILPPAFDLLLPDGDMIVLIKPQFELAREQVGRGGIVKDAALHDLAVEKIRRFAGAASRRWMGVIPSPITGRDGNQEFLAHLKP